MLWSESALVCSFTFTSFNAQWNENKSNRIVLPFKDQKSPNAVRRLSRKINVDISPVCTSRKIKDEVKVTEAQATPCKSTMCCVSVMSATRADTFTSELIGNRRPPEGAAQYGPKWHCAKFQNFKKVSEKHWLSYSWNAFYQRTETISLNKQCDFTRAKLFV